MITDNVHEIGIDNLGRLYIKPKTERFTLICRTATEIHWDNEQLFLYAPKPREWSYFDWYIHIVGVVENECNCKLILTGDTIWVNISKEFKNQIEDFKLGGFAIVSNRFDLGMR